MLKNKSRRKIGILVKNKFVGFFRFLGRNTWIFTILFFGAVLIASVWIWWQCVYSSKPSRAVMQKIETEKEDFDDMKKKTVEAITFLQKYRDNYNNSDKFGNQRELFINVLDEKVIEKLKEAETVKAEEIEKSKEGTVEENAEIQEPQNKEAVEDEVIDLPTKIEEDEILGN